MTCKAGVLGWDLFYMTCKAGVLMSHYTLIRFGLKFRLLIGLHQLPVYHRWKENIKLYNI